MATAETVNGAAVMGGFAGDNSGKQYTEDQRLGRCCMRCDRRFARPDEAEKPSPPMLPQTNMRVCRDRVKCVARTCRG
ncbi:hypothetical protein KIPE111705_07200 [Kibdelosporangium persicum]